jgi:hypothetical protein
MPIPDVTINEVAISGGPLPEGPLVAYSYDPITSCVYLTKLVSEPAPSVVQTKAHQGSSGSVDVIYTGVLYPGIIKLVYSSTYYDIVGSIKLVNGVGQVIFNTPLSGDKIFDTTLLSRLTFGYKINDQDTYTLTINCSNNISSNLQLISLELPTGVSSATIYDADFAQSPALTGIGLLSTFTATVSNYNPLNTSWGYIRKNGKCLVTQTLAPFPPPFYDPEWSNPIDYIENTNYVHDLVTYKGQQFFNSETFSSTPDLSKVCAILDDIHARPTPSCYSVALVTQEDVNHQLFWRCMKEQRQEAVTTHNTVYNLNKWVPSEKVYKYKAGSMYFGGKDYSGPLNSVLVDGLDGITSREHKVLDLNEFPINAQNELYVHAYVSNYSTTATKVYCVLNKTTGRMAEIDVTANPVTVKYFTVIMPVGSNNEICNLYYTNRLMYTIRNTVSGTYTLYDANNGGAVVCTFTVGSFNPAILPQFTIIN